MTQRTIPISPISILVLAAGLCGCGGVPESDQAAPTLSNFRQIKSAEKLFHEWKKVYSVELKGADRVRTHVGFLDYKFTEANPDGGTYVVRDLKYDLRGFLDSKLRAYVFEARTGEDPKTRDLGNTGLENGVKKILDVPGGIEFEAVKESSVLPAGK